MIENRVKRILRQGGMAVGTYAGNFPGSAMVEIIGHAGFDAVFIDLEHCPFGLEDVQVKVLAAERVGITPIVRTPGFDPGLILRLLDIGVQGIQIPGVPSAEAAVRAVLYAPLGDRSLASNVRASDYGVMRTMEYVEQANREVLLAVMVEDLKALEEVEVMASTPGVDLVTVGPSDLAQAMGVSGQVDHPKLAAAIERVRAACGKPGSARMSLSVAHAMFPRTARQLKEMGVGYANCAPAPEIRLFRSLSQQAAEIRGQI